MQKALIYKHYMLFEQTYESSFSACFNADANGLEIDIRTSHKQIKITGPAISGGWIAGPALLRRGYPNATLIYSFS